MFVFPAGITDYINSLEGVKDPDSKKKFMDGIKNMANHGVPNGIFDIMVSASAQNQQHIKTIETLTQVKTCENPFCFFADAHILVCHFRDTICSRTSKIPGSAD